jgi:chromosome segregation ATPase
MLSDKIDHIDALLAKLLDKHAQLKAENDDLRLKLKETNELVKTKEEELNSTKEKMKLLSLAKQMDSSGESENKKELKLKINEVLREIDKCIAVLKN